jgi:hypothetical protein
VLQNQRQICKDQGNLHPMGHHNMSKNLKKVVVQRAVLE